MPPFKETKKPAVKPVEEVLAKIEEPKQEDPKQEDPKQEDPKQEDPKQEDPKTLTVKKVRCRSNIYMVNPFTGDRFLPNDEVEATLDSWLECQIAAGLVKCS